MYCKDEDSNLAILIKVHILISWAAEVHLDGDHLNIGNSAKVSDVFPINIHPYHFDAEVAR